MIPDSHDIAALRRDKYEGREDANMQEDTERLTAGEPLAYVIGWIPFLAARIRLDSHPLIPRVETEYWTEQLINHLRVRFGDSEFALLDLCAGSGAIGIAILKTFPHAHVSFGELNEEHIALIHLNLTENDIQESRADIRESYLFESFTPVRSFDVIATNPPYIPRARELPPSVLEYEPHDALYAGDDGLSIIRKIVTEGRRFLAPAGEMWIECDIENATETHTLMNEAGATASAVHADQYGRARYVVGEFE